jgi:hypothetical protein
MTTTTATLADAVTAAHAAAQYAEDARKAATLAIVKSLVTDHRTGEGWRGLVRLSINYTDAKLPVYVSSEHPAYEPARVLGLTVGDLWMALGCDAFSTSGYGCAIDADAAWGEHWPHPCGCPGNVVVSHSRDAVQCGACGETWAPTD